MSLFIERIAGMAFDPSPTPTFAMAEAAPQMPQST